MASRDLLIERIRENEETIKELNRRIYTLNQQLNNYDPENKTRRTYPRDHPRDPDGRILGNCLRCGEYGSIHARGLCSRCYKRWYRASVKDPQKNRDRLGSLRSPQ